MKLVGATAIEDKLQDGVPDAIAKLAKVIGLSVAIIPRSWLNLSCHLLSF